MFKPFSKSFFKKTPTIDRETTSHILGTTYLDGNELLAHIKVSYPMNRTEALLQLRPKIKTIKQHVNTADLEQFQNDTLRPVLKFQHDILLALFNSCLSRNKVLFKELSTEEKEIKITQLFQKDLSFKNQSLGAVLGMLTLEEYRTYSKESSAYNRRIITILKQRIMSTY